MKWIYSWSIIYLYCGERYGDINGIAVAVYIHLTSGEIKAWKKFRFERDSNPWRWSIMFSWSDLSIRIYCTTVIHFRNVRGNEIGRFDEISSSWVNRNEFVDFGEFCQSEISLVELTLSGASDFYSLGTLWSNLPLSPNLSSARHSSTFWGSS